MRLAILVAATGAIFTAGVTGLACKDGLKYCAYNLQSGGHFWTEDEIWSQLQSEGLPDGYTRGHIKHTLFKCEDRWHWAKAHLYYVEWCANSCENGGNNNDDRCRPHTND
ncbi:hypothetical protein FVEN_g8079 [Fusarium venenatum]|uniref:Uncharacterized protein n=1 Tax=Fusarium venenatum TaxID=56646 RepID=A0A2L2SSK7_9HYPO|nr:uncharacterized protein FVRRES_04568 [Fusarium venenatum]KAG8353839.1 hypothetical protein FVEN_g8079 [Fusarium venenatum]KAH6991729.1 hypothetical protein EDB82DRAFT_494424 [Fusarium venenatum]CEI60132.1 unnamed protein product [Fusarium venenatum]